MGSQVLPQNYLAVSTNGATQRDRGGIRDHRRHRVFMAAGGVAPKLVGAVRVIMDSMSEVAESAAVLDDLARRIAERFAPDRIILFGSRARGDAGPDSDIGRSQ